MVDHTWEAGRAANLANWEDRVPLHEVAYGLEKYDDPTTISTQVQSDLKALAPFLPSLHDDGGPGGGDAAGSAKQAAATTEPLSAVSATDVVQTEAKPLAGLRVCHLQCHIGTDTISLARAGASVVGVDFSPSAIASAAKLAARHGDDVTFVETDVLDAAAAVHRATGPEAKFDLVYTSVGTIDWLKDLDQWAKQIAALLRPGGLFYINDGHPLLYIFSTVKYPLSVVWPYFNSGDPVIDDEDGTYVGDGKVANTITYSWVHPISEIINALIGAGLRIERMDEGKVLSWRFNPHMLEVPVGNDVGYVWPEQVRDSVPNTFTIIARAT